MHQVQPFTNEEIMILEGLVQGQKTAHEEMVRRLQSAKKSTDGNEQQIAAFSRSIQQLELLLLKIKSFKNN